MDKRGQGPGGPSEERVFRCLVLVKSPFHVPMDSKRRWCTECGGQLWERPRTDPLEGVPRRCFGCVLQTKDGKDAALLCRRWQHELVIMWKSLMDSVPSRVPTPSWHDVLARPDMKEQPIELLGCRQLVHLCVVKQRVDLLRLVLRKWPDSVNLVCRLPNLLLVRPRCCFRVIFLLCHCVCVALATLRLLIKCHTPLYCSSYSLSTD